MPTPQPSLPSRPLPALSSTLQRLADASLVLRSEEAPAISVFYEVLSQRWRAAQAKMQDHAADWQHDVMTRSYLEGRQSLAFYSNVFYLMERDPMESDLVTRASQLLHRAFSFRARVQQGTLPREVEAGYELDQSFYPYFFGTTRCPQSSVDSLVNAPHATHVIVACRGHLYLVEGGDEKTNAEQWQALLRQILAEEKPESSYAPALWTTLEREAWADVRARLLTDPLHAQALQKIESAAFWVALERDEHPETRTEAMRILSFDRAINRWYDKSHQIVVCGNGVSGINRDHTLLDGHPSRLYLEFLQQALEEEATERGPSPTFQRLDLTLPSSLEARYQELRKTWEETQKKFWMEVFDVHRVGLVWSQAHKRNADFIVQAALHYAAYQCFGRFVSISESVHMRHTYRGRYDSILSLSYELQKFWHAWEKGSSAVELLVLYFTAEQAHRQKIKECKLGHSPLLHLAGLLQKARANEPSTLSSEGDMGLAPAFFQELLTPPLTSSGPGYCPGFEMSGFTDTVAETIGVSYLVKPDRISFYFKADGGSQAIAQSLAQTLPQVLSQLSEFLTSALSQE